MGTRTTRCVDGEDDVEKELRRIRGLATMMRELGVSTLSVPEAIITLGPEPAHGPIQKTALFDLDEAAELSDEQREADALSAAEKAHNDYWRRLTRSSGAPIPPFKPRPARPQ